MTEATAKNNKYDKSKAERQEHIDAVLNSASHKKIVVAGPGTGKTYLFKEILKGKRKTLTLTFVNTLVEDLSLELYGISDVKTLHGYARSLLGKANPNVKIYPKLSEVIKEDAKIILAEDIDFDQIFHNLDDKNEHIKFYKNRKDYYGEYYGYSDIVYAIVKYFEGKKDKIPKYDQVVVDEFQDFNKLEVALIDLLSSKNPILLAGDDDQALYDFKSASPEHIRQRYDENNEEYASFTLPYCSRCTSVIVEATNDIITSAVKVGNLTGRVRKEYKYFDDEHKDKDCSSHPNIAYSQTFANQMPWFIEKYIGKIAEHEKTVFSVLVISPTKIQIRSIAAALKNKGFENVQHVEKKDDKEPPFLDGLKILLENDKSNLGWRIVCKTILNETDYKNIIDETNKNNAKSIHELINKAKKKDVKKMLKVLKAVEDEKNIDEQELIDLLDKINVNPYEIAKEYLRDDILLGSQKVGNPGVRKIPIKATTIQSSKGLSADYVFITHFDDQYFIRNRDKKKITDQDICNFLVALTRAKKKVFLISSGKQEPTFLKWINNSRLEKF